MENCATEIRTGEIIKEFGRLNESKEQLHNRIDVLANRLKDVLRKESSPPSTGAPKEQLNSPMAIDLSSVSSTIEADLERINELLDRLEL